MRRSTILFQITLALVVSSALACSDPSAPSVEPGAFQAMRSGKVMFQRIDSVNRAGVFIIDAAGQTISRISTDIPVGFGPALSPVGDQLAFLSFQNGCYAVVTADLSGHTQTVPASGCNQQGPPTWSPNGSGVVFQQGFPGGNDYGIYFAPQGGEPRIAVALPVDSTHTLQCPALVRDLDFGSVSMNARGGVAFRCGSLIWGTLQAGDSLKPIVSAAGMPSAPSWSPDGNALAFLALAVSSDESISQTRVVIMDFATRRARYIAAVPGHNAGWWTSANVYSVCWLSDSQLAFNAAGTDPDGAPPSASIYVVNVDGSGLTRVTTRATAFDHSVSCSQN